MTTNKQGDNTVEQILISLLLKSQPNNEFLGTVDAKISLPELDKATQAINQYVQQAIEAELKEIKAKLATSLDTEDYDYLADRINQLKGGE